jgi:hypothetical protein
VANRESFVPCERLPLLEAHLHADAIEFAADRHRHAGEAVMDLVFEFESPYHFKTSRSLISAA